jgi:hypothetical protein
MMAKNRTRDPIKRYHRKQKATRRVGAGKQCHTCGEARPEALIRGNQPIICALCERKREGKRAFDEHHVAGRANNPNTIPVAVNDHRAELNVAQYDWPKETLENRDGSPLLAAAACLRGVCDLIVYLIKKFVLWIVDMLETLDAHLAKNLGPKWWEKTDLERFKPKR